MASPDPRSLLLDRRNRDEPSRKNLDGLIHPPRYFQLRTPTGAKGLNNVHDTGREDSPSHVRAAAHAL